MDKNEEKNKVINMGVLSAAPLPEKSLQRRMFSWWRPWFLIGAIVFAISVTLTMVNNSEITINFIVASMTIRLPLLMLSCALLGSAIVYFTGLDARSFFRAENRSLKQQITILDTLVKKQSESK